MVLAPLAETPSLVLVPRQRYRRWACSRSRPAAYTDVEPYPLDVLGAQTEGMIGYMIEQELGDLLPAEGRSPTILTMIEVDADAPAFDDPTKFVGPDLREAPMPTGSAREGLDASSATRTRARRRVSLPEPEAGSSSSAPIRSAAGARCAPWYLCRRRRHPRPPICRRHPKPSWASKPS